MYGALPFLQRRDDVEARLYVDTLILRTVLVSFTAAAAFSLITSTYMKFVELNSVTKTLHLRSFGTTGEYVRCAEQDSC
jgi:hypothetical protein